MNDMTTAMERIIKAKLNEECISKKVAEKKRMILWYSISKKTDKSNLPKYLPKYFFYI